MNYQVLKQDTQKLMNKNIPPVYSDITKIKLDPINMQLSTLSTNGCLNIFTETNNGWQVKNTLYNCNDIPVSNQDGNILALKKSNTLEIRSLLAPHYGKVACKLNFDSPIVDFSINSVGNTINVFFQQYKNTSDIHYHTLYNKGGPAFWAVYNNNCPFRVGVANNMGISYTNKINSLFTNENKLIVFFNTFSTFPSKLPNCKKGDVTITTQQERISRRQNSSYLTPQNFRSSSSSTSRFNRSHNLFHHDSYDADAYDFGGGGCGDGGGCDGGDC
jgi:hypothetical protein